MELRAEKYKQTEIGLIPSDWEVKKLVDIGDIATGTTPPTNNKNNYGEDYFFVSPADLGKGKYIIDTEKKLSKLGFGISRKYPANSILFTCIGSTIGKSGISKIELTSNQQINAVFPNDFYSSDFLFYYLSFISPKIKLGASEQAVPMINKTEFGKTYIAIPTKTEQTLIATALSDADALISSLEKLIAKKRNIKQGAMQKLLQSKVGWEVKKLGEVGECIIGLTYTPENVKESGTLVLRSSNVQGCALKYDDNVYVDSKVPEKLINKENDILICVRNGSRDLIGKCALLKGKAIGETFGAFMSVYRSPFNEFIFILFQSEIIKKQIDEHLGATINQITNKSLNSFEIPFPSMEEQTRIATILSDMDNEITALETKLEKYKKVKLGMMQNLLTGKIRLV